MSRISEKNKSYTDNLKMNEELVQWWNGIPNAQCLNLHRRQPEHVSISSPVSRVSLTPKSPASNSFSNGYHFAGDACPYPDVKHQTLNDHYSTKLDSDSSDFCFENNISANWENDLGLSENFLRMNITDGQGNGTRIKGQKMGSHGFGSQTYSLDANIPTFTESGCSYDGFQNGVVGITSSNRVVSPSLIHDRKRSLPCSGKGYAFGTSVESSLAHDQSSASYLGSSWKRNQLLYHLNLMEQEKKQGSICDGQVQLQKSFTPGPYLCDGYMNSTSCGRNHEGGCNGKNTMKFSEWMHPTKLAFNLENPSHCCPTTEQRARAATSNQLPHFLSSNRNGTDPVAFRCDNSFTIQEKDITYCIDQGCNSLSCCRKNSHNPIAGEEVSERNSNALDSEIFEYNSSIGVDFPLPLLLYSLAEVQGYIFNLAKDQNGCRYLQRIVDEGTSEAMQIVFDGIIHNVVDLMIDPFGNYLVQKLLDVCGEEMKSQIVFMVTEEPGQLVKISLNTHGTRVVQKLIDTLNTRQQISLVMSALRPGFLDLIKDLNGNHVIQRCLQRLTCQDNEFIFDAAAKFCVDIATHRHGCCVLQRCIDKATGKYRDKLVTEICRHGLLLAQDPFGNYVVQYIIEMQIPAASAKLISLFKGNYVNLSTQKFSSHVVEKCLKHVAESRPRIVRDLMAVSNFEQLLQDPYANYVIQSALAVTKGSLHASLVEAVRPYKILRTSPYCKRIFSGNLLKN
ncbi:hypothetical protein L6164_016088 [Bauhinia variegata]|uniref:Uncharacterized protein n=1 Tax=Bauhinia variegata TaxID=167791 RepID=A0ACB9NPJ2_BAUVA|nr:hypothetical protein L6164_016088 [Bauhinia variegata]